MTRPGWPERTALAALFLAGAMTWAALLSADGRASGPVPTVEDWPKEFRHYTVLRQAVVERRLPLFVSRPILAGRKLLAVPELNCAPPVLLLGALSIPHYVLMDTLVFYALGFAGLLRLRRRYGLGWLAFSFLFLLFFLNGHLVAHMAVGHSMWAAHFLLPVFVLGLLELVEGGRPATPALLALVMFAMLLRGGVHLFAWCTLFLILLAAFNPRRARPVAVTLGLAAALGAVRLIPAAFLARRWQGRFLSGFPSAGDLLAALASIRPPNHPLRGGVFGQLAWWEYDTFVGGAALALLAVYGVALAHRQPALERSAERGLYGPAAALAFLSLGDTYLALSLLPLPLLGTERVSARLLVLPLLVLGTVAALRMDRRARAGREARAAWAWRIAPALAVAATGASLVAHAWTWRVQALAAVLPPRRGLLNVELVPPPSPLAGGDLAYVAAVAASAVVSAVSLALVLRYLWRTRGAASGSRPA